MLWGSRTPKTQGRSSVYTVLSIRPTTKVLLASSDRCFSTTAPANANWRRSIGARDELLRTSSGSKGEGAMRREEETINQGLMHNHQEPRILMQSFKVAELGCRAAESS